MEHLAVFQERPAIIRFDHWKFIRTVKNFPSDLAGEIAVFDFPDIHHCVFEQKLAVTFQRADMIRILMRDQDVLNRCRIHVQPAHFFLQTRVVVACIDHDGSAVLRVEENVGDPLPDAFHALINSACVQRFEDRLPAKQHTHGFLLMFRIFSSHILSCLLLALFPTAEASEFQTILQIAFPGSVEYVIIPS